MRAIHKGIKGLAACFEPFKVYGSAPKLRELLSESDRAIIQERAQESMFIVGGKHIEGKRIGTFEDAITYWSHKLNALAYQFQCVVTHFGHCVYVSNAERAATHDMMVYRNNRTQLLAGLAVEGFRNPIILADQGYKYELPELYVPDTPCKQLNARRLVIENYFGRMANVFRIVRVKFPFGYDIVNPFLKALCFLTNVHVFKFPLRREESQLHRSLVAYTRGKHVEKRERKQRQQCNNTQSIAPTSSPSHSPFSLSLQQDLEVPTPKRAPFLHRDEE